MKRRLFIVLAIGLLIIALPIFAKLSFSGQAPVASFTYSPTIPTPHETITFDASASYDSDGLIARYAWNFGDGTIVTGSGPIVAHSYPIDGNFTVELTVTDNSGLTATAAAVVQVRCIVFFRVCFLGSITPLSNVTVTAYYNNGTAWVAAPASNRDVEIRYDLMTQPNLANTNAQRFRNPGYTASILLLDVSNIGFDVHPEAWTVFFKFQWGSQIAYWPNCTDTVYTYNKQEGIEIHYYDPNHQAYWDSSAGTYVIRAGDIAGKGVSASGNHPIVLGMFCPPPPTTYYLNVKTDPIGITTIPGQGGYAPNTNVTLTAETYVDVSSSTRYRFNYWDVDGTSRGIGVNPITVLMNANHTATAHYTTQYFLTVSSVYDSPTPTSGWYDSGTSITASVTSPASGPPGTQYVCTGWTGTGSVPASGTSTSTSFTLTQASSITWNWKTQYFLTVSSARGVTGGQGWYDSGAAAYATVTPLIVAGPSGTQYVFTNWSGDAGGTASPSNAIAMNGPKTATANWKTQYYLTVSSAHDSPSPTSGWFDSGTSITASVTSPSAGPAGTQYVCTGWTGTGSTPASGGSSLVTFTINAPSSITWNWKTQYQVIFDQSGVGSDFTGTVVMVDGAGYGCSGLPTTPQFWWDQDSSHNFSYASPLPVNGGKNYVWTSTSGLSNLQSGTFTITGSGNVVGNYVEQNRITFDQIGVGTGFSGTVVIIDGVNYNWSQLPVSFPWVLNTDHSFAFQSPLVPSADTKYVWNSTTGLTSLQSGSITVTTYGSIIGNYKTQYYLTVSSAYGATDGQGWYDSGSPAYASVTPLTVAGPSGTQYVFTNWSGDASGTTSPSNAIAMNGPKTATANWKTQYYLAVSSLYGTVGGQGWYDSGSTAYATVTPLAVAGPSGTQYVFTNWSGDASGSTSPSNPIVMGAPKTATATWKTQYYLTLVTNPLGVDSPSGSGWYDAGTNATISADAYVPIDSGSRYRFDGWTTANMAEIADPTRIPTQVTMDEGKTVTANYFVQYKLTFNQTGVSGDFAGAIVTIDGTNFTYGTLPHDFWWDDNSQHSFTFQSPLVVTANNKQYVWVNTTGLSTVRSGILTVSTSGNVTGNYKTQYWLTVSSAQDTPTPTSGWFDAGTFIPASVTTPWAGSTGTRFVCTGWTGTGSVPPSGTGSSVTFTINQASSLTWNWKTQYILTVLTDPSGLSPQPVRNPSGEAGPANGWWYDASTSVTLTAQPVSGYSFKNWAIDGTPQGNGVNPVAVIMNGPHTSTAGYERTPQLSVDIAPRSDTIFLYQSVDFTSSISGGVGPYNYQWYVDGLAITGANSPTWKFTPSATGVYHVYLKATDSLHNTVQSPTAQISVITVPVGGYTVSVGTRYPTLQIAVYAMLLTLFGAGLGLKKRKRK